MTTIHEKIQDLYNEIVADSECSLLAEDRTRLRKILSVSSSRSLSKPSVKIRIGAIVNDIDTTFHDLKAPTHFKLLLLEPPRRGSLADREDAAFKRLFMGYDNDHPIVWATVLSPISPAAWDSLCIANDNDDGNDENQVLLDTESSIAALVNTGQSTSYLGFVFRTIWIIRFMSIWEPLASEERGRTWKTNYITAAFRYQHTALANEFDKDQQNSVLQKDYNNQLKKFRSEHGRIVGARSAIYKLYKTFGPSILLDPFWDIHDAERQKLKTRTNEFNDIIHHLVTECPTSFTEEDEQVAMPVVTFETNFQSLFYALKYIASPTVASYICNFVLQNPPTHIQDLDLDYSDILEQLQGPQGV
ncbi:hypothetical protein H0H93_002303 [Arthromyces matolae]|nr:hypothetical protein H0H93_002303 [Arthromyces matolae]